MKKIPLIIAMLSIAGCGGSNGTGSPGMASSLHAETAVARQGTTNSATNGSTAETITDSAQYLMDLYQDGLNEIELGQLALQKNTNGANNSDVKRYAQRMIDDHTRANSKIQQLAQGKGITLPSDLSAAQRAEANRLDNLSGDEFNVACIADNDAGLVG